VFFLPVANNTRAVHKLTQALSLGQERGTPPPLFSKDVILGELAGEVVQGCDSMGVKFTGDGGRICKAS
jgi:hypothetical protein